MITKTKDVLSKTLQTIKDPNNWTKSFEAITKNGIDVRPEDPEATTYCLYGALRKTLIEMNVIGDRKLYMNVFNEIEKNILHETGPLKDPIFDFNDAPETKHEDVIHILEKTIANL